MSMEETREIFSHRVTAGRRTYFFDVKQSRDGTRYLVISESQVCDTDRKHHRVMVFEEHIEWFTHALEEALRFLSPNRSQKATRKCYPNAYKPWTPSDDEQLRTMFQSGFTISALSEYFGRRPSAIRSRLRK
ncbi:MAG: DUF3276 family protein [Armatimonadota bacterium]